MSMDDRDGYIWLDGEWVDWREAKVHVLTHTLHYGLGVFEGIRAYHAQKGTAIFRLQEHTDRLFRSAHIMNMQMPFSKEELNKVQCDALVKNKLDSAYIRSMCFLGSEGMGLRADNLKVHVMVAAWSWGAGIFLENERWNWSAVNNIELIGTSPINITHPKLNLTAKYSIINPANNFEFIIRVFNQSGTFHHNLSNRTSVFNQIQLPINKKITTSFNLDFLYDTAPIVPIDHFHYNYYQTLSYSF